MLPDLKIHGKNRCKSSRKSYLQMDYSSYTSKKFVFTVSKIFTKFMVYNPLAMTTWWFMAELGDTLQKKKKKITVSKNTLLTAHQTSNLLFCKSILCLLDFVLKCQSYVIRSEPLFLAARHHSWVAPAGVKGNMCSMGSIARTRLSDSWHRSNPGQSNRGFGVQFLCGCIQQPSLSSL